MRAAATTSRVADAPVSSTAAVYTQMTRRRAGPGTSENRLGVWAVFHIRALLAHVRALLAHIRALLAHIGALLVHIRALQIRALLAHIRIPAVRAGILKSQYNDSQKLVQ